MSRAESNCVCAVGISFGLSLSFFTQCNIYHSLSSAEILPRNARHFALAKFGSSGDSLRSLPHPLRMTRRGSIGEGAIIKTPSTDKSQFGNISYLVPVDPKPPAPRAVSSSSSVSSKVAAAYGVNTICAMRSPLSTVCATLP